MRKPLPSYLAPLLAILIVLPSLAMAHGPNQPRGHVRMQPRTSVNFGVSVGTGFYSPGYYSPYWYGPSIAYPVPVYTPPPVVIQQPPVYIEQPVQSVDAGTANYWYYCAPTRSYYPYVNSCAEAWQRVPPTPPADSPQTGNKP